MARARSTIENGIVSGCTNGIYTPGVASTDGALIKDIIAFDNYQSIYIRGNNNRLLNVTVTVAATATARDDVLGLDGRDNNQVKGCYLSRSNIFISGRNNTAISNIVEDVKDTCLYSVFGGGSVVKNNTFRRCGFDGMNVDAANSSIVGNRFSIDSSFSFYDDYFTSTRIAEADL